MPVLWPKLMYVGYTVDWLMVIEEGRGTDAPSYIICWPTHPGVLILEFLKSITLGMAVELVPRVSFEN